MRQAHSPLVSIPPALLLFSLFYGGMVTLGGVLGSKQIALGPWAFEAGIFSFVMLVSLSSAVTELYGHALARRLVRFGFVPLIMAILLTLLVLALPADSGMNSPARAAFPIVLGQSWRMMFAGIAAYGVSVNLNIWLFASMGKLASPDSGARTMLRSALAAFVSQIIDTLIFITVAFLGVRPILTLLAGQMLTKLTFSAVLVPLLVSLAVRFGRWLDQR